MRSLLRRATRTGLLLGLCLFGAAGALQAQTEVTLVSNIRASTQSTSSFIAQPFTTGANTNHYTLAKVELSLNSNRATTSTATTDVLVRIVPNSASGAPDLSDPTKFITLTTSSTAQHSSINTYTAPAGARLDANTTYHVFVTNAAGTGVLDTTRVFLTGNTETGETGWSIGNTRYFKTDPSADSWSTATTTILQIAVKGYANAANNAATGAPTISGIAQEGQTLTANAGTGADVFADADGLPSGTFPTGYTFQWVRVVSGVDNDIAGATSQTYMLTTADVGNTVKVKVSFTDGANNAETLTSAAHPATGTVLSASACAAPDFGTRRHIWTGQVTVGSRGLGVVFPGQFDYGYRSSPIPSLAFGALNPTDFSIGTQSISIEEVTVRKGGTSDGNLSFDFDENLSYTQAVALELHVCHVAIDLLAETNSPSSSYRDFTKSTALDWSGVTSRTLYLSLPANTDATGAPEITGTVRVDETLTAGVGTLADADGLPTGTFPAGYSLQWVRVDGVNMTDIPGATSQTYELTEDDLGKTVKVKVSFRDQRYVAAYTQSGTMVTDAPLETRESAASNTVTAGVPGVPQTFTATAGDTQVTLAWTAPASDGEAAITKYQYRHEAGTTVTDTVAWVDVQDGPDADDDAGNETSVVVGSLTNGTEYAFEVRAVNSVGEGEKAGPETATPMPPDTTAPTFSSAAVDGATLVITMSENLAAASNLANSAFTVKKTPNGGSEATVSLSGTPSISGAKVTLTLATAVLSTDTGVKVSYTIPGTDNNNRLEDAAGNETANFTDQAVTNATTPTVSSAAVDGATLVITFKESLAAASNLANSAFSVKKTPNNGSETAVSLSGTPSISGATVTLTLAAAVVGTDTGVKVSYTKPGTDNNNRLEDAAGNEVASFTDEAVTNNTNASATGMPTISGTAQVGQTLTAGAGNIDDTNGLPDGPFPTDYTFQWVRFNADGTTGRTEISGATSRTYMPGRDDFGKKLKVEVSFNDDLGNSETRISAAHPTTGTVIDAACAAPAFGTRRHFWTGDVTVGASSVFGGSQQFGFQSGDFGALAEDTFTVGSTEYEILATLVTFGGSASGDFAFELEDDLEYRIGDYTVNLTGCPKARGGGHINRVAAPIFTGGRSRTRISGTWHHLLLIST